MLVGRPSARRELVEYVCPQEHYFCSELFICLVIQLPGGSLPSLGLSLECFLLLVLKFENIYFELSPLHHVTLPR